MTSRQNVLSRPRFANSSGVSTSRSHSIPTSASIARSSARLGPRNVVSRTTRRSRSLRTPTSPRAKEPNTYTARTSANVRADATKRSSARSSCARRPAIRLASSSISKMFVAMARLTVRDESAAGCPSFATGNGCPSFGSNRNEIDTPRMRAHRGSWRILDLVLAEIRETRASADAVGRHIVDRGKRH